MDTVLPRTKILVIDDDPLQRELIRAIFEDAKYEVIQAEDAVAGFELAITFMPQLIVTDMRMSRMTGLEFIQKTRKDERLKHIPIVVSTAMHSAQQAVECLRAGASDYLTKPINPAVFGQKVRKILGH